MVLLLLLFLFISTFLLFSIARHDFVLLRQNISLRLIFDKAIVLILVGLIVGRIFYAIDSRQYEFLTDPLQFLHLLIYWGVNFLGVFVAMAIGLYVFFRKRKNFLRIFDIYVLAFFPLLIFQILNYLLREDFSVYSAIGAIILGCVLYGIALKKHNTFKIRDGAASFLTLIGVACIYLAHSVAVSDSLSIYSPIQIVAGIVIAVAAYCLALVYANFFKDK